MHVVRDEFLPFFFFATLHNRKATTGYKGLNAQADHGMYICVSPLAGLWAWWQTA